MTQPLATELSKREINSQIKTSKANIHRYWLRIHNCKSVLVFWRLFYFCVSRTENERF